MNTPLSPLQRRMIAEAIGRLRVLETDAAASRAVLERFLGMSGADSHDDMPSMDNGPSPGATPPDDDTRRLRGFTREDFLGCKTTQEAVYIIDDAHPGISPHEISWILRTLGVSSSITPASASSMRSRRPKD